MCYKKILPSYIWCRSNTSAPGLKITGGHQYRGETFVYVRNRAMRIQYTGYLRLYLTVFHTVSKSHVFIYWDFYGRRPFKVISRIILKIEYYIIYFQCAIWLVELYRQIILRHFLTIYSEVISLWFFGRILPYLFITFFKLLI